MTHHLGLRQARQTGFRGPPGGAEAVFEGAGIREVNAGLTGGALLEY